MVTKEERKRKEKAKAQRERRSASNETSTLQSPSQLSPTALIRATRSSSRQSSASTHSRDSSMEILAPVQSAIGGDFNASHGLSRCNILGVSGTKRTLPHQATSPPRKNARQPSVEIIPTSNSDATPLRKSSRLSGQNVSPLIFPTPLDVPYVTPKNLGGRPVKQKRISKNSSGRPRKDSMASISDESICDISSKTPSRAGRPKRRSSQGGRTHGTTAAVMAERRAARVLTIEENEEELENEEAILQREADRLNEEADRQAMPPPRRSTRTRQAREVFVTDNTATRESAYEKETPNCRNLKHKGLGCAAMDAHHYPEYYDSAEKTTVCQYCDALLLARESNSMKCCAQGRVNLKEQLEKLQEQPMELKSLFTPTFPDHSDFMKNTLRYNNEFSFGTLGIDKEIVPHGLQVAKINGQIKFNLSDLFHPYQHDVAQNGFQRKWGQCYTIMPDAAIDERLERLDNEGAKLKANTVTLLHRMIARDHPLAKAYRYAADEYARQKRLADENSIDMPRFRMVLLSKRKAVEAGYNPDGEIHDHRLLVPTKEGMMQIATVHFTESGEPAPPAEKGVHLYGIDGKAATFGHYDPNIDPAIFPLLFPFGQESFKMGIKLAGEAKKKTPASVTPAVEEEEEEQSIQDEGEESEFGEEGESEKEDEVEGEITDCGESRFRKRKGAHLFVSRRQWYRYMMQVRGSWLLKNAHHWLWGFLMLAQMYILTAYNRIEADEADSIRQAQPNLVAVLPSVLIEAMKRKVATGRYGIGGIGAKLGKIFFAPETFRGSRRYYQKAYADAQAMIRAFGSPHVLLTYTLNSCAPELSLLLGSDHHSWADRPDIIARVFMDKHKEMMKDIMVNNFLGPVAASFNSVEHQKRGLPHFHLCLILKTATNNHFNEKNWTPVKQTAEEWCRQYIKAEIPLINERATGHRAQRWKDYRDTVVNQMAHRCSINCVDADGNCSKRFPRPFSAVDYVSEETYPMYRRRPPAPSKPERLKNPEAYGEIYEFKDKNGVGRIINNSHIVPHNPYLLMKYKSHINIEWIQGDLTAKYVTKYITKGCDMALVKVTKSKNTDENIVNYDEFEEIRCGVYRTASEAALAIYGHPIFSKSHSVETHHIHEPGNVRTVYCDGQEEKAAEREQERIDRNEEKKTKLTEYFALNTSLGKEEAEKYSYATISQAFWWKKSNKSWNRRKIRCKKLVRVGIVAPGNTVLQAIRILLLSINGPTSFDALKMKEDGTHYPSFMDAAIGRGLMVDDSLWDATIGDALPQIRSLSEKIRWFALFIENNRPKKPTVLLEKYFTQLTEWRDLHGNEDGKKDRLMRRIEIILRIHGTHPDDTHVSACEKVGLEKPRNFIFTHDDEVDCEYFREDFMRRHLADEDEHPGTAPRNSYQARYHDWRKQCTPEEQLKFVNRIFEAVNDPDNNTLQRCFFLTGEGGTGKTFTYNTIIAGMKASGLKILPCATTGIAATLLIEGSTVHRRFNVPIDVQSDTPPKMDRHSNYAALINAAQVIVIDEVSMQDRYVLEYLDRLLRSICGPQFHDIPFGGKIMIIGGDWKQLLPVIPGKGSEVQFTRSVKSSSLWKHFETIRLTINKRQNAADPRTKAFSRFMRKVATGVTTDYQDRVELPENLLLNDKNRIIDFVFPPEALANPLSKDRTGKWNFKKISDSALLCPTNAECNNMNNLLMEKMPGESHVFKLMDEPQCENNMDCLSVYAADRCLEHLNRSCPSGLPPHELQIKRGAIMMLIKNLSVVDGLCNGTRIQVIEFIRNQQSGDINALLCRYISGPRTSEEFVLYKTGFTAGGGTSGEKEAAFKWTRTQFPLRPGFVMTVNKAQGQTLDNVGLLLQNSACFSHGQLYVALSRVRTPDTIRILLKQGHNSTKNIVYQPAIDKEEVDEAYKMAEEDMEKDLCPTRTTELAPTQVVIDGTAEPRIFFETNVRGDGNCFFRAIANNYYGDQEQHQYFRQAAANALRNIDLSGTVEELLHIEQMIRGVLVHGNQWEDDCESSITRYAAVFTEVDGTWAGHPEAQALAIFLNQPIVIIRPGTEGNEIAYIHRRGMNLETFIFPQKEYELIWTKLGVPLVVCNSGGNHFTAIHSTLR